MKSTIQHGSFTIEREFMQPINKIYDAFADKALKAQWFGASDDYKLDFQVGGKEVNIAIPHEGLSFHYEALYYDIVLNQRIVYSYEMYMNNKRISVSLATIEFTEAEGKTKLTLREDGAFLDGDDTVDAREGGTRQLLDRLEANL